MKWFTLAVFVCLSSKFPQTSYSIPLSQSYPQNTDEQLDESHSSFPPNTKLENKLPKMLAYVVLNLLHRNTVVNKSTSLLYDKNKRKTIETNEPDDINARQLINKERAVGFSSLENSKEVHPIHNISDVSEDSSTNKPNSDSDINEDLSVIKNKMTDINKSAKNDCFQKSCKAPKCNLTKRKNKDKQTEVNKNVKMKPQGRRCCGCCDCNCDCNCDCDYCDGCNNGDCPCDCGNCCTGWNNGNGWNNNGWNNWNGWNGCNNCNSGNGFGCNDCGFCRLSNCNSFGGFGFGNGFINGFGCGNGFGNNFSNGNGFGCCGFNNGGCGCGGNRFGRNNNMQCGCGCMSNPSNCCKSFGGSRGSRLSGSSNHNGVRGGSRSNNNNNNGSDGSNNNNNNK